MKRRGEFDASGLRGRVKPTPLVNSDRACLHVGDYYLEDYGDQHVLIANKQTGELGAFPKAEFEAYVSAFFGLNF